MTTAQSITTKPGRSALLSTYVRNAHTYGSETAIHNLAAEHNVDVETVRQALNLATIGR